ncbi:hypothetical protein ACFE04_025265 [Oxalis oulophora]
MRKHGWQLPYHPLQVVAVAVFLALGFAYYVFFAPFVGNKLYQYIAMAIYTPLIFCVFSLYIWCAAADPADPGVFRSKKYLKIPDNQKHGPKGSKLGGESTSSIHDLSCGGKSLDKDGVGTDATSKNPSTGIGNKDAPKQRSCLLLAFSPCAYICNCGIRNESSEEQMSEDGMFYCSLCEVEVFKYSKHCRVCDKCVDSFDHHCRWINNCIGKRNYRQFFTLMIFAILMLIIQWCTGILVLICCFIERKRFATDISSKLGSSFSLAMCTILAMIATLPLAQLFCFHILLIKKGISTYDYIIALREQEQEQQGVGPQSPQMSPVSSLTGLSSASSFSTFHRGAWCTPPRLFLEDQFDVVPPDTGSVSSYGKKMVGEEPIKKKNPGTVKISPWALARLNAEVVSKAAAEARKKSKIIQPVSRRDTHSGLETNNTYGSSSRRSIPKPDNNRRRNGKRIRLPVELSMDPTNVSATSFDRHLAPLQLEARSAFQTSQAMSNTGGIIGSSPDSSLDSPDIHPFRVSSSGAEESKRLAGLIPTQKGFPLTRSTSDGYEASGGEDSDRVPSRIPQRSTNWSSILFSSDKDERVVKLKAPSSSSRN